MRCRTRPAGPVGGAVSPGPHMVETERQGWIDDPSIPVLTERLFLTAEEREAARLPRAVAGERAQPLDDGVVPAPSTVAAAEGRAADAGGDPATAVVHEASAGVEAMPVPGAAEATPPALADELRDAVLSRVAERLPAQIDAALRERMQPAIDQAVAKVGEEARVALRASLADLVDEALRDERARRSGAAG